MKVEISYQREFSKGKPLSTADVLDLTENWVWWEGTVQIYNQQIFVYHLLEYKEL